MAIIQKTETSKTILDEKEFQKTPKSKEVIVTRKKGFIRSTIAELKLVKWPTLKFTLTWATTVVLFSLVLTVFVGGLDKVFKSGFEYATCTANAYKGTGGSTNEQCGKQFGQSLITFN